jgi:hypothetical protein
MKNMNMRLLMVSAVISGFSAAAYAKLPPAPPPDPAAVAAKAEKDKAAAEKGKVLQAAAEDRAVKSYQANMKKAGKPIPKPTPIVVAAAPAPVKSAAPAKDAKPAAK